MPPGVAPLPVGPVGPVLPVGPATVDAAPVGPVGPTFPCAPVGPVGPATPVGPVGPGIVLVAPVGPVGPGTVLEEPVGPVGPVGPGTVDAAPVAPVGPVGPVPEAPVGPVGPAAPVGPVGPFNPSRMLKIIIELLAEHPLCEAVTDTVLLVLGAKDESTNVFVVDACKTPSTRHCQVGLVNVEVAVNVIEAGDITPADEVINCVAVDVRETVLTLVSQTKAEEVALTLDADSLLAIARK